MMEGIKSYLLALCAVCLLAALVTALTPKGSVRRVQVISCGILAALVCLTPLHSIDGETVAQTLARLQMEAEAARTGITVQNRELVAAIITEQARTYILDKAAALGLSVTVEVEVSGEDTYPYPAAVTITGTATPEEQQALGRYIAETLGVGEDAITWK